MSTALDVIFQSEETATTVKSTIERIRDANPFYAHNQNLVRFQLAQEGNKVQFASEQPDDPRQKTSLASYLSLALASTAQSEGKQLIARFWQKFAGFKNTETTSLDLSDF